MGVIGLLTVFKTMRLIELSNRDLLDQYLHHWQCWYHRLYNHLFWKAIGYILGHLAACLPSFYSVPAATPSWRDRRCHLILVNLPWESNHFQLKSFVLWRIREIWDQLQVIQYWEISKNGEICKAFAKRPKKY